MINPADPQNNLRGTSDAFLSRFDTSGNGPLWSKQFGSDAGDGGRTVATDSNGNAYVGGSGNGDCMLAKYDRTGAQVWLKQFGSSSDSELVNDVVVDANGNVFLAGFTSGALSGGTADPNDDAFLAKYSTEGAYQWVRQFGVSGREDNANGITLNNSDQPCVVGTTSGPLFAVNSDNSPNAFLVCYSDDGNPASVGRQFAPSSTGAANANSVALGPAGLMLAGTVWGAFLNLQSRGETDGFIMLVR